MSAQPKKHSIKQFLQDFLMGGVAGAIAKTTCAPIERVKLLLQVQHTHAKLEGHQYTGIANCFQRVLKEEGILAFWRGNMANVIRYFPTTAINFSVKDFLQGKFVHGINPETQKRKFFLGNLLAGGMAGAIGLTVVYPLDFVRTRLGVDVGKAGTDRQYKGLIDCASQIFKSDGVQGLYRGYPVSVVGIFVYRAFYFGGYDSGKRWVFGDDEGQKNASFLLKFFFAQFVVTTSETISFPLDTIRRRLMMQSGIEASKRRYSGTVDCATKILSQEGVGGFFKGNLSNVYRSIGSSLVLVLYDKFKKEIFVKKH